MASVIEPFLGDLFDIRTSNWLAGAIRTKLVHDAELTEFLHLFSPATNRTTGGACFLLLYDWAICLDQEISFVWKARLSAAKVLYLLNRYPLMAVAFVGLQSMSFVWISLRMWC